MTQKLNPFSGRQFLDANGVPYVGAKLFIYQAGKATKQIVTMDLAGTANHINPIILNARGEPADVGGSAQAIWQPDGTPVKLVLAASTDTDPPTTPIDTWDNISGINDTSSGSISEWISGGTPSYLSASSFSLAGDETTIWHIGRRVKTINAGGTYYGTITNSVYSTVTTITVLLDTGSIDAGISSVYYGFVSSENTSSPGDIDYQNHFNTNILMDNPPATSGTGTAYTFTLNETVYTTNRVYRIRIHTDNTGACTGNMDGIGAKNIKLLNGNDPKAGDLITGMVAHLRYDGTNLVVTNYDQLLKKVQYPLALQHFGDGSDGAYSSSGGPFTLSSGEYWHTTYILNSGDVLTVTDNHPLIIRATVSITINANIVANANGGAGGTGAITAGGTGGTGGLGATGGAGATGSGGTSGPGGDLLTIFAGPTGAAAGSTAPARIYHQILSGYPVDLLGGSGGGGGGGDGTTNPGANGGQGGGVVILIAPTVTISAGVTISANGAVGSSTASSGSGGGGGGGGGFILLIGRTVTNSGTLTANGAAGGSSGAGGGGAGSGATGLTLTWEI